jgi:hypothetical protein
MNRCQRVPGTRLDGRHEIVASCDMPARDAYALIAENKQTSLIRED